MIHELIHRDCPVCLKKTEVTLFSESNLNYEKLDSFSFSSRKTPDQQHFRLTLCQVCGLLYSTQSFHHQQLKKSYQDSHFEFSLESKFAAKTYFQYLKKNLVSLEKINSVLDVGAGDGAFLSLLKEKGLTRIAGVEPSIAPFKLAHKDIQAVIRNTFFNSKDFQSENFDLISHFMTLEHLEYPFQFCQDSYHLLNENGYFVLAIHDYKSSLNRFLGLKSPIYDIEHLQLFSKESILHLLQKIGFKNIQIEILVNHYPLSYFIRLMPFLNTKIKNFLISVLGRLGLKNIELPLRAGNLFIVAQKVEASHELY